jgi:hypothetical protein
MVAREPGFARPVLTTVAAEPDETVRITAMCQKCMYLKHFMKISLRGIHF